MKQENMTTRSVIVLGYGPEPFLEDALAALQAEAGPDDEVVLVDNGIHERSSREGSWPSVVRVVGEGANRGFAGGCVHGVASSRGEVLIFVNSDAIVRPGALDALTEATLRPSVGIACGCLRLAHQPELVNSVGNPVHFSGISWAGGCGEPAERYTVEREVPVATGGLLAMRRAVWDALDGFDELYFAYNEDTDLSLRAWLAGWCVLFVPSAVADHHYEFGRSPLKMYLVERNRLLTVLTDYPSRLLRAVAPALVVIELLLFVQALLQGWAGQKIRSWWWLVRNVRVVKARRARVQAASQASGPSIVRLMVSRIEPTMVVPPPGMGLVNRALDAYWRFVVKRFPPDVGHDGPPQPPGIGPDA
jgi:GT2 family glycosyltransferase